MQSRIRTPLAAAAAIMMIGIAGCSTGGGGTASPDECGSSSLRLSHQNVPGVPHDLGVTRFAELLEERSDGRITLEIFGQAQLGDATQEIQQMQAGALDFAVASPAGLSAFYPNLAALAIPYSILGDNEAEQHESLLKVRESEVIAELTEDMAEKIGIRGIDFGWWFGNRQITNNVRPIETPEDLEGLILRVPDAPIHSLGLEMMGAATTGIAWSETFLALQTGTVDGQENPPSQIDSARLDEVQTYMSMTAHLTQGHVIAMSEKTWDSLCAEDQEIVIQSINDAGDYQSELALAANVDAVENLRDRGMIINEPDLDAFREATEGAAEKWADEHPDFDPEIFDRLQEAQK